MTESISVIIPTLNEKTLVRTIEALLEQTRPADEIVVVGRDEAGVTRAYPQVLFIDTGRPVCAAAARNKGMETARGDIIAFTDSDCIPDTDWLKCLEDAHTQGADIVGGGISLKGKNYWAQSDNVSMFHDFVDDHPAGTRDLLPTLNLSVRRTIIDKVGYMDESFPGAAAEDTDWTVRMCLAGHVLHFHPPARVQHAPARTQWRDLVRHWTNSGYSGIRVRHRYAFYFNTPSFARSAFLLRALSPLIALRVTASIYANSIFWRHLAYLPVVYLTKIIYCFGAANSVKNGFAFDHPTTTDDVATQPD